MKWKKILKKIDKLICNYLDLHKQDINPQMLRKTGKQIVLTNTESFRRHLFYQKLDDFFLTNLNILSNYNKQRLGASVGQLLADDLIISFESIAIKEKENA